LCYIKIQRKKKKVSRQKNCTWGVTHRARGGGGGGYSLKFQIGVCRPGSKTVTLLEEETNENLDPI